MAKYRAMYKCLLCGRMIAFGEPQEVPYDMLPELLGKVVQNQLFAGNPYLHKASMQIPHNCSNGAGGLAWFAGFAPDEQVSVKGG